MTDPQPRTWRIELPAGMRLLTSNQVGGHWGGQYAITKPIKDAAILLTRAQKVPLLDRAQIVAEWRRPHGRRVVVRDTQNLAPSVKAAIDGIKQAGALKDDSDKYLASVEYRPGEPHPLGQLVLILTELPTPE